MKTLATLTTSALLFCAAVAQAQQAGTSPTPTPNTNTNQKAPTTTRLQTPGNATINCSNLYDSRCATNTITSTPTPTCTVTANPASLTITAGSVNSTITASCTAGTTQYQWYASSGTTPSGISSSVAYFSAGTYCYHVQGKNPAASINFGTASPDVCVVVTQGSVCPPGGPSQQTFSCPANYTGSWIRNWTYDTNSCTYSYTDNYTCAAPVCTGGQVYNGSSCACPGGTYLSGGVCLTIPVCTGGQSWNSLTTMCECPSGQSLVAGACQVILTLCSGSAAPPANTTCTATQCNVNGSAQSCTGAPTTQTALSYYTLNTTVANSSSCPWQGPYAQSMICGTCPAGTTWDNALGICKPNTPPIITVTYYYASVYAFGPSIDVYCTSSGACKGGVYASFGGCPSTTSVDPSVLTASGSQLVPGFGPTAGPFSTIAQASVPASCQ